MKVQTLDSFSDKVKFKIETYIPRILYVFEIEIFSAEAFVM